jgi:peroxiredoxin Q/BCP
MGIKIGSKAPDFRLKDRLSKAYSLQDIVQDYAVVYFYPRDNTPGCAIEAKEFTEDLQKFKKLGVGVVGISGGDKQSKKTFCKKHKLKVRLLSDTNYKVCRKYNVYGKKKFMGREFMGIKRTTFIIDKKLRVLAAFKNITPEGHSAEILAFFRRLA